MIVTDVGLGITIDGQLFKYGFSLEFYRERGQLCPKNIPTFDLFKVSFYFVPV